MKDKQRITPWACILPIALTLGLTACGGGGGGGGGSTTTSGSNQISKGYTLPSEISAVPTDNSSNSNSAGLVKSFGSAINRLSKAQTASGLPSTSDYATTQGRVFVEEPALERFAIIEQVLNALGQTNYADEIGTGPYKAVVAWTESDEGKDVMTLQTWTVQSNMVTGTHPTTQASQQVNVAQAWIPEIDPGTGEERMIKAQFDIYTSAEVAADGSYVNYGEWDLNVYFDADPTMVDPDDPVGYFAAEARLDENGVTTLKVVDRGIRNEFNLLEKMDGVLVRSQDTGYGVVSFPNWESCFDNTGGNTCVDEIAFPTTTASYAYNPTHLVVQEAGGDPTFKDRNLEGAIKMVHRYGLFYADPDSNNNIAEGENVENQLSFGFPVRFEMTALNANVTFENWGYYGAWQGRHELWGPDERGIVVDNGSNGPLGTGEATVFTRADLPPNQTAPSYTMVEFDGTFTKRDLVKADLNDIKNVPVEAYIDNHFGLFYKVNPDNDPVTNDTGWYSCSGWVDWWELDPENNERNPANACKEHEAPHNPLPFTPLAGSKLMSAIANGNTHRSWVNIGYEDRSDPQNPVHKDMVFLSSSLGNQADFTAPGFYEAEWGDKGLQAKQDATKLEPTDGLEVWVSIGGVIYVSYIGFDHGNTDIRTGFAQKVLNGFDEETWTPTFKDSSFDTEFVPDRGKEYYMHSNGQNYVVMRNGTEANSVDDYIAKIELQTTANPANTEATATTSLSLLPAGTVYLASPWDKDAKYTFQEDPENENFLMLTVAHDERGELQVGSMATGDTWGLVAYADVDGDTNLSTGEGFAGDRPIGSEGNTLLIVDDWGWADPALNDNEEAMQFTWEYAGGDDGNTWGKQRFLKNVANDEYEILSDPIQLQGVPLFDSRGIQKRVDPTDDTSNFKLINTMFDGWMHGLPDMYHLLSQNNWDLTLIEDKVVHIQEGTRVRDNNGTFYFVKPLDTSLFLGVVNQGNVDASLTLADATAIANELEAEVYNMPTYTAHEMGAIPEGAEVVIKYTEGKVVE